MVETEKTLAMIFRNQGGNTVRITVDDVKDGITGTEVKNAMNAIITMNIFDSRGGDLVSVEGAEIITRSVQELSVE